MKAFEKWDKEQPVTFLPEPFATYVTKAKKEGWKAALEWIERTYYSDPDAMPNLHLIVKEELED